MGGFMTDTWFASEGDVHSSDLANIGAKASRHEMREHNVRTDPIRRALQARKPHTKVRE